MTFQNFTLDIDRDGIAVILWDMPRRPGNAITVAVIDELSHVVERIAGDTAVTGAVLASGKETFATGLDPSLVESWSRDVAEMSASHGEPAATAHLFKESRHLSQLCRRIETCGKPFAAAINGSAFGAGFELALACHHRVAADHAKARVGLSDIKIGLMPSAGGVQRVARLLPPADALQVLLKGERMTLDRARGLALIDAVVPPAGLVAAAKAWIAANPAAKAAWDRDNFKLPGGPVYSKAGMASLPAAIALYRRETHDNYPAARAILQALYDGLMVDMDTALRIESRWLVKVLRSPQAMAMMRTQVLSTRALNAGARRPADVAPTRLRRIGIIGAGFMGASIASLAARAGPAVVLIDRDQGLADKGKARAQKLIAEQADKGHASPAERDAMMDRIAATADYAALADCDLVIEAVFEDRAVKAEVLAKAQAAIGKRSILASNTSTLPITSLASPLAEPARLVGIHFLSPVAKMMLVEVIRGRDTGDKALAVALDFVRLLGRTPIVVNDAHGFYTSRVVMTYLREGHLMLVDGVPPAMIENAARKAGMPVGPLALTDEIAVDLTLEIMIGMQEAGQPVEPRQKALLVEMVERRGRLGRKNGKGFYDYPAGGKKRLWPGLTALASRRLDPARIDLQDLKDRLLTAQALETARCFEEGVLTDVREADVGAVLGFGFAPFTGGTLSHIDTMGTPAFVALCEALAARHGPRFAPSPLLTDMARKRETFYGRFAPNGRKAA